MADSDTKIFVLTDNPAGYEDSFNRADMEAVFVREAGPLLERLRNEPMAGLVLEMGKVMKADRRDRDRLFNYADSFPVLRTKLMTSNKAIQYLDSRDCFFENLDRAVGERCRSHERTSVELACTFSREQDPTMHEPAEGTVLDISPGGCFINTTQLYPDESFVHLRIPHLSMRPIYSSVRWSKLKADEGTLPGMGIMFIDLDQAQLDKVISLQLEAPPQKQS